MDKLIEILDEPTNKKWGLYKIKFKGKDGEYISYQTAEEFRVTKIKQRLFFEKGMCLDDINEFEEAVRECTIRDHDDI